MNYYFACWAKAFDFSSRARRSEYWFFALFNIIFSFLFGLVVGFVVAPASPELAGIVNIAYQIAVIFPALSVSVRRLHDTDHSGWWLLIILLPLVGALILLLWMVREGTPGPNKYGPNPKAPPGQGSEMENPPEEPGPKATIAKL